MLPWTITSLMLGGILSGEPSILGIEIQVASSGIHGIFLLLLQGDGRTIPL